ncbi:hypothetical protein M426DRAFT_319118 [Hypoxylon sp. CI-4A]|nr:hypothetical protein M426DRAFT_319118 [Hypoxylon sp. CI-4A]
MLLRQLQRPSTRSVTATAAATIWRPTPKVLLHGSSRRRLQSSPSSAAPAGDDDSKDDKPRQPTTTTKPSLFEKLFPDEAKQAQSQPDGKLPKNIWASQHPDEPEPLPVSDEALFGSNTTNTNNTNEPKTEPDTENDNENDKDHNALRAKSMLILDAASKHLTESDFLRLGRKGAHVEGWVSGLTRVVQARDPDTLAALGYYFLLFTSEAAAVSYRDEVERLWQLAREHAHYGTDRGAVPSGLLSTADGRDVAAAIRGFTLVPPSQRHHVKLSTAASRELIEELDLGGGSFVDRVAARAGSKYLVLVTVDGGRISVDTLRRAIEEDGVRRSLPWRVTDLESGILPFGKSILKPHDRENDGFEQSLLDQVGRAIGDNNRRREGGVEEDGLEGGEEKAEKSSADDKYKQYPRFVIPFADGAEAHRFVRGWHRREFKLRMDLDEDKNQNRKQLTWDETRILNTSVLW